MEFRELCKIVSIALVHGVYGKRHANTVYGFVPMGCHGVVRKGSRLYGATVRGAVGGWFLGCQLCNSDQ